MLGRCKAEALQLTSSQCCLVGSKSLLISHTEVVWQCSQNVCFMPSVKQGIVILELRKIPALMQICTGEEEEQHSLWCSTPRSPLGWGVGSVLGSMCNAGTN